ncbi:MAG: hut operon positive regulator HutP [Clostridiales bacterium]|nr:hut operon positive regulator HutP [Clostridiales bacterium]
MEFIEDSGSRAVARAALSLSMSTSREEEARLRASFGEDGVQTAAADYGGEYNQSVMKLIERAVIAAKREHVISDTHHEQGAVAGAAHEAISQVSAKAFGLSIGGKIAVARKGEHVAVALFLSVGLVHLNEVCVGLGHRAI